MDKIYIHMRGGCIVQVVGPIDMDEKVVIIDYENSDDPDLGPEILKSAENCAKGLNRGELTVLY